MEIKDLCYKNIFNNLNIKINKNEITAIVGKNGSGKTTILNLIYGLDKDFGGEIKIGRRVINKKTKKKNISEIRKDIVYLRQEFEEDLFNINVYEDIKYGKANIDEKKLYELLNLFNLDANILSKCYINIDNYEKKKALLIKMLMGDYKILLLDDVTNYLDSESIEALVKILKREKRDDKIIIITSMDSNFLLKLADKFIVFDNGHIRINEKYEFFGDLQLLNRINMSIPNLISFKIFAQSKNIKLMYRDDINDLIKDVYRNAKK